LFKGINDSEKDIQKLLRITRRFPSKINLIPFNDISFIANIPLIPANYEDIVNFSRKLYDIGVRTIIRKSQGLDIAAACGQLAICKESLLMK
jgi:23S rRNA (adenine2503-C2)-methyltransferase